MTEAARIGAVPEPRGRGLLLLAFGSLGVVFGDIGTSPLYALRACFNVGQRGIPPTPENIFHVLRELTAIPAARRPCRWAIVATAPAQYGMGRLFQAHAEDRQIEIQVFKLHDEALAWLSADR